MRPDAPTPLTGEYWTVDVAGLPVRLPIVAIKPDFAISLMMVIDLGVKFGEHAGRKLAEKLAPLKPDIIVGAATLGIPVAIEVTRALGLDAYVILQKSPKIHLGDALVQNISSITSKGEQRLLLDRQALPLLAGKRVVVVDDVVASGSSLKGSVELVRSAGGEVVGIGVILTEARDWQATLGQDAALIHSLAHIPQFTSTAEGWQPIPETFLQGAI
jgi:adenine/guanine phosphoribosyltransferase-like PRPP-binding protein